MEHSKKPDIVRDSINILVGTRTKLELFAREKYNEWDNWGNDPKIV
jgi:N6-adenosine-specific RNA methylase IME4